MKVSELVEEVQGSLPTWYVEGMDLQDGGWQIVCHSRTLGGFHIRGHVGGPPSAAVATRARQIANLFEIRTIHGGRDKIAEAQEAPVKEDA
jgi:hypothetical protein